MTLLDKIIVCDMARAAELLQEKPCSVGAVVRVNNFVAEERTEHEALQKQAQISLGIESLLFLPDVALTPEENEAVSKMMAAYDPDEAAKVEKELETLYLKVQARELHTLIATMTAAVTGLPAGKKIVIHDSNGTFRAPATALLLLADDSVQEGNTVEQAFFGNLPNLFNICPTATLLEKQVPHLLGNALALLEQHEEMIPAGQSFEQRAAYYEDEISKYGSCVRLYNTLEKVGSLAGMACVEIGHYALPRYMAGVAPDPSEQVSMRERAALVSLIYKDRFHEYGMPPLRPDDEREAVLANLRERGFKIDAVSGAKRAPGLGLGS